MNEGFQSSLDHLLAELKRIELKLRLQIMSLRQGNDQTGDGMLSRAPYLFRAYPSRITQP